MPWPAEWATVYERPAPLVVEIGFGNGRFLLTQARQRPEVNFLGLEIATPSMDRTDARLRAAGLTNVRLIRATAQSVLWALCQPASIDGVTINFPDPWPKATHSQRRLISSSFLALLASRMAGGAELDIATDHAGYGIWITERLLTSPHFDSRLASPYVHDEPDRQRTKYEQKGLAAGSICFYFKWRRNSLAAPDAYPVLQELPMPHVVARSPLTLDQIAESFEPRHIASGEGSIRLIDLYKSQRRPALIIDTYIAERPVEQRLMLEIYRRPDGDYLIRLMATGFPRSTAGVHTAIDCLAKWMVGLDPGAEVVRHNLRL